MNQNEKEDQVIGDMIRTWAESTHDPVLNKKIQRRCLSMIDLLRDILPYKTESCLDTDQAQEYAAGEKATLKRFGEHVGKCADHCQKLVEFYQK
ncbi:hypothetical protein KY306_01445 [Candidatus Woesearchaeota archaeon]|nr:hypothetical protein [Candidatus Woesearchaeota archaeon]